MDPAGHTLGFEPEARHVEIQVDGVAIATSDRALIVRETGLPARHYLPRDDVRLDISTPSPTATACPFKGQAVYFHFDVDGTEHRDLAWSYERPINGAEPLTELICFFDERVDVLVEGELQARPETAWSPSTLNDPTS
jgi:uncharacterized protein (DUF427 family)